MYVIRTGESKGQADERQEVNKKARELTGCAQRIGVAEVKELRARAITPGPRKVQL
jgi:hypothetical protein